MKTVAIGDVHGCYTLLQETIKPLIATQSEVVFLGDLIDRSPESDGDLKVLRYVNYLERYPHDFGLSKVTVLSGNHEQLLINALEQGTESSAFDLWELNGGNPLFYEQARQYLDWLKARPFYYTKGPVLFVHAGVRPDVPLEKQNTNDLIWIRDSFLNVEDHGLPYYIVHGHTIVPEVDATPYRINIDTGAFYTGNLTSVELTIPS